MASSSSAPDVLGRLADELLERHRRGEQPALTEYTKRYPDLADQIRELFSAVVLMEGVRPAAQPPAGTTIPEGAVPCRRLGEYCIVREIGRGGMGVVYEAEQESLGRRVALKVLPPGALADPRQVQRFQREARAAARLHHTNIVPVFGVGEEGGTHYYVMQYIEGRPLDEVLAELRRLRAQTQPRPAPPGEPAQAGASPGEEPAPAAGPGPSAAVAQSLWQGRFRAAGGKGLGEADDPDEATELDGVGPPAAGAEGGAAAGSSSLLSDPERPYAQSVAQVGVQVAEALEYAAAQGVLHRDIKPSNLLLDVFGRVWLTDFGLAKATGTPDLTHSGDLLGTLRYMAPERFQGRADVRSDVYALGLTLYELLALRPAFGAAGQAQLIGQITSGEPPRLDGLNPQLPRDLVTIVHKAIARDPGDRYQTAAALAEDLRRFLEDRSILARRASLREQAWRWCRRNPAGAALLAALLALLLLASGGGAWLVRLKAEGRAEAARQEQELRQEVVTALAQVASLRRGFQFRQANQLLERVQQRLEPASPDDLRRRLHRARADLDLAKHLDAARLYAATLVEGKYDYVGAERRYAAAFAKAGLGRAGDAIPALAARVRASAVRAEIVGALDDWASLTAVPARRKWLLAVARAADPHPGRDRLRRPALWRDGARLKRLTQKIRGADLSPQLATALARALRASGEEAAPLLAAAQARFPNDFWLNYLLASTFGQAEQWDEALGYYRAALALRPETVAVHFSLGDALRAKGRLNQAVGHFRQALRLDPKYALVHLSLGRTLANQGRRNAADAHYRQALRLHPRSANAHNNLAIVLHQKGRRDEAIAHFRRALRLEPGNAATHSNLAITLQAQGRLKGAIYHFRQSLRLDPNSAPTHYNLGTVLVAQGRRDEAIDHFEQALCLDPKHASAHTNLATALYAKGRVDEAIHHYRRALRLDPEVAKAHGGLGIALEASGRRDEAINHYRQAVRLDPKWALIHYNLGTVLIPQGRLDEAIDHLRKALRLEPKHAEAHCNLGHALQRQGHFAEAFACLKRGHQLGSKNQRWPYPSGQWVQQAKRLAALETKLPAVLQGKHRPANAAEGLVFAHLCRAQKRYAAAARLQAKAFAADPKLAADLQAGHRYNAACFAALAAAGKGKDASKLDDRERARLRQHALDWLRADLVAWAKAPDRTRLQTMLQHWQRDPDLAGVRGPEALRRLPPAEREGWRKLWLDVAELLRKTTDRARC
jgi:tetratricopeptide (TPR) repeat protein